MCMCVWRCERECQARPWTVWETQLTYRVGHRMTRNKKKKGGRERARKIRGVLEKEHTHTCAA